MYCSVRWRRKSDLSAASFVETFPRLDALCLNCRSKLVNCSINSSSEWGNRSIDDSSPSWSIRVLRHVQILQLAEHLLELLVRFEQLVNLGFVSINLGGQLGDLIGVSRCLSASPSTWPEVRPARSLSILKCSITLCSINLMSPVISPDHLKVLNTGCASGPRRCHQPLLQDRSRSRGHKLSSW